MAKWQFTWSNLNHFVKIDPGESQDSFLSLTAPSSPYILPSIKPPIFCFLIFFLPLNSLCCLHSSPSYFLPILLQNPSNGLLALSLTQGLANCGHLFLKNRVLVEHSHVHLFIYCLAAFWL